MRLFYAFMLLLSAATITAAELPLLPYPAEVTQQPGRFNLTTDFSVSVSANNAMSDAAVARFLQRLSRQTGLTFTAGAAPALLIQLNGSADPELPPPDMAEQYRLNVSQQQIRLSADSYIGIVRGLETLLQLVQTDSSGSSIAVVQITDAPRFSWRGLLLDPARRFLPIETLKRQLDIMALVKLNVLHLHLTDDQGWRFESLNYPKLQQIGGVDGYYSQQQLRELVHYAAQRGIRIVPEIDLPGHTTALGAAYPALMALPGANRPETHWGVHQAVLDPTNEQVYDFLANLLAEVAAVFPDRYLHIGGDEVLPDHWLGAPHIVDFMQQQQLADVPALQAYFNTRLQKIVQQLGRQMIGWDEVLDDKLPTSVLVQSWRGTESLALAAKAGHQAILSTGYYLDQPQFAAYHYRNDPLPVAQQLPDLNQLNSWSAWQFSFARKRGAAINGRLLLLYHNDDAISAVLQFNGRQPQLVQQLKLNANRLSFSLDSWMGPLFAELSLSSTTDPAGPDPTGTLAGSLTVGNAAYAVSGTAIAPAQPAAAALPITLQAQTLNESSKARIIGGEIALWGELVTPDNIDIRLWPNGFAVAERLWSPAGLRDEDSLYRRLSHMSSMAEINSNLRTISQQRQGFTALVSDAKLPTLLSVAETLEPAHYYHRLHEKSVAGLYHKAAPLNQLVDYLPAEQPALRHFTHHIQQWLVQKDKASLERINRQLALWQQAATGLAQTEPQPLSGVFAQVQQLSQSALMLLDSIHRQQPISRSTRTAITQQLQQASTIQQELIIALRRPLQQLLAAAPHSEIWVAANTFSPAVEGPTLDSRGNLYAVNFGHDGTVGKVTPDGNAALYLTLPAGSTGNGIVFDSAGTMFIADYTGHNILRYQHGQLSVHAHNDAMHQPNDLAIMQNGVIFASDPNWADNSGQLWRIDTDGSSHLLDGAMGTSNGIAVSPDQQYLYVNESVQRTIWRYRISADFSLSNKQVVARFSDFGLDGMRFDSKGNLYVARYGKGTIAKLTADGTLLAEYRLNHALPTNVIVSHDDTVLYVTVQQCGCIERILLQ
ncbi:family 20 glycosylhydrolase [Rheinheimera sp.]|uniref:family 20 glycosylhydrolase n=1 Tax=Rheinheimera sp. TaxID=1869214 RepID=UPI0027368445|nr:family 20 glycosylhydrolase [Rheinheimera sp.]MDP2713272.1 family 20 glycosylhydrolase [Rheinheimera sp.]